MLRYWFEVSTTVWFDECKWTINYLYFSLHVLILNRKLDLRHSKNSFNVSSRIQRNTSRSVIKYLRYMNGRLQDLHDTSLYACNVFLFTLNLCANLDLCSNQLHRNKYILSYMQPKQHRSRISCIRRLYLKLNRIFYLKLNTIFYLKLNRIFYL